MVALILLAACRPEPDLSPLLVRASLDLRGVRPSVAELDWVQTDPSTLDSYLEAYLQDARFGDRVLSLFGNVYRTRAIEADHAEADYGIPDEVSFTAAMGEEPLRLLAYVATHDRPYPEVVTADYTVLNEVLAPYYPSDYPADGTGWQLARYTDGRPSAGVLSTPGFYWRYQTTESNANRGRANAVSRIFLCNDYLSREVVFDTSVSLVDADAVNDALNHNPSCVNCHVSLDPLAGIFWGFAAFDNWSPDDLSHYHPDRERDWQWTSGTPPAYFGTPLTTIADLGRAVANDDRFASCAVQQVWEALLQRPAELDDTDTLLRHREDFLAGGTTLRSLFRSVMASDAYRAVPATDALAVPWKLLDPDQLGSAIADLTGYRFVADGKDVLTTDLYGIRSLVGGSSNGAAVVTATVPTPALVLLQERLAQAAGMYAAQYDHDHPADARLYTRIDWTETLDDGRDTMVTQVQDLFLRILSKRVGPKDAEVDDALGLWFEVYAAEGGDPIPAWAAVSTALMRRPEFLAY